MKSDEKLCPYCGETIKLVAIKCKHCKSDLSDSDTSDIKSNVSSEKDIVSLEHNFAQENPQLYKLSLWVLYAAIIAAVCYGPYWLYKNTIGSDKSTVVDIQKLILSEKELDNKCRGGSGNDPKTFEACDARDALAVKLNKLGWCYGKSNEAGYQMKWHQCESNSLKQTSAPSVPVTNSNTASTSKDQVSPKKDVVKNSNSKTAYEENFAPYLLKK